jgi:hypothetical protein
MSDFDTPATTGNPESAAWFQDELEALGMTQTGLAKWLKKRGENEAAYDAKRPPREL